MSKNRNTTTRPSGLLLEFSKAVRAEHMAERPLAVGAQYMLAIDRFMIVRISDVSKGWYLLSNYHQDHLCKRGFHRILTATHGVRSYLLSSFYGGENREVKSLARVIVRREDTAPRGCV